MSSLERFSEYDALAAGYGVPASDKLPEVPLGAEADVEPVPEEGYESAGNTSVLGTDDRLVAEPNNEPESDAAQPAATHVEMPATPQREETVPAEKEIHDAAPTDPPVDIIEATDPELPQAQPGRDTVATDAPRPADEPVHVRWRAVTGDSGERQVPRRYPKVVCVTGDIAFEEYPPELLQLRRAPIPGEAEKTGAEIDAINGCNEAIVKIGDRIGVDMRDRLQSPEEHHFFNTRAERDAGVLERMGERYADRIKSKVGFSTALMGIVVIRGASGMIDGRTLPHEKAHGACMESVISREVPQGRPQTDFWRIGHIGGGYSCSPGAEYSVINELSADIVGWETRLLMGEKPTRPCYRELAIVGGYAIATIADNFGVTPRDVADKLVLGSWTTDQSFIDLAHETFGDASKLLFGERGLSSREALGLAGGLYGFRELEVPANFRKTIDDLQKLRNGQPVNYFDWL